MYHAFVRRKIIANFEGLAAAVAEGGGDGLAPDIEHIFSGEGAIGGTRHTAEAFRRWTRRVYRLFPDLKFTVKTIMVSGGPWNTRVAVEWHSEATTATGDRYENDGMHFIRVKLGKVVEMHAYLDTAHLERTLAIMHGKGFLEAALDPIT